MTALTLRPDPGPAPRTAYEAADQLAAEGHHVHVVAHSESICHTGHCKGNAQ
jgi:hypothetical protein